MQPDAEKKSTMSEEQRKSPRIDFHVPLTIKGHEGVRRIKDFSLSGLFIDVEDPSQFAQGDEITLVLELPYPDRPIEVKARVTRLTGDGIAVEFGELYPAHRVALEECFSVFRHTVPMPER